MISEVTNLAKGDKLPEFLPKISGFLPGNCNVTLSRDSETVSCHVDYVESSGATPVPATINTGGN